MADTTIPSTTTPEQHQLNLVAIAERLADLLGTDEEDNSGLDQQLARRLRDGLRDAAEIAERLGDGLRKLSEADRAYINEIRAHMDEIERLMVENAALRLARVAV